MAWRVQHPRLMYPPPKPIKARSKQKYYIRDTRQIVGNCVLWWAKDSKGYTCELELAGLFDRNFCQDLRDTDVPYPQEEIDAVAIRHVRIERIRDLNAKLEGYPPDTIID